MDSHSGPKTYSLDSIHDFIIFPGEGRDPSLLGGQYSGTKVSRNLSLLKYWYMRRWKPVEQKLLEKLS